MDKKIISILLSLIITFFFIVKYSMEPLTSIIIFVLSFVIINYSILHNKKKYRKMSIITSIILSIIYLICDSVEKDKLINIFDRYFFLNIFSYFIIFYFSIINLFSLMDKYKKKKEEDRKIYIGSKEILTTSKLSFVFNFILIFIIYLIALIKFYPGNLTFDSYNEIMQIKGILPLMNNHSILHTGILALFIKFGLLFKNISLGIFLYNLFQIILVSLLFAYILHFLAKFRVPLIFRIVSLLLFAFHPINIIYSICVWKDIFFSLSFVLYTILIYYFSNNEEFFNKKKNIILFIIISLLVMYLRNNGVYVVILSLIVLFIIYRKKYKKILPIFLGIIVLFFGSRLLIFNLLHINDFEIKEMLSFPSQSIARIYKYDYDKLSKKDIKSIEKYYSKEIGEVYNPIISDNVKNQLDQKYLLKHKADYFKLNTKLFFKYNKRYLESFISNNYGYYYMNTYYPSIILQDTDMFGVKHIKINSIIILCLYVLVLTILMLIVLWNLKEKKNILLFGLLIPILMAMSGSIKDNSLVALFFNVGFYITIVFLTIIYNIKNKKSIIYYIPSIILWISILFSPVYAEFRYLYPIFILVPLFVGITMKKED